MCQLSPQFRYRQMELRMHRYFKKNENILKVKTHLGECSVGDWWDFYIFFVKYFPIFSS